MNLKALSGGALAGALVAAGVSAITGLSLQHVGIALLAAGVFALPFTFPEKPS